MFSGVAGRGCGAKRFTSELNSSRLNESAGRRRRSAVSQAAKLRSSLSHCMESELSNSTISVVGGCAEDCASRWTQECAAAPEPGRIRSGGGLALGDHAQVSACAGSSA